MATDRLPSAAPGPAGVDLDWLAAKIPYSHYQSCVHCGLCTASCPTYVETLDENDGPRGRIYLMRAVADGRATASAEVRRHLDLCLDCRACETACPSGVRYGQIIEPFKIALDAARPAPERPGRLLGLILHHLFPYPGRVKLALLPARWMQRLGLLDRIERAGLFRLLPPTLRSLVAMLPDFASTRGRDSGPVSRGNRATPPVGPRRARVALFTGCVAEAMYPETNAATMRVLAANGCEVVVPAGQACCGAIHYHSGAEGPALDLARRNLAAFDPAEVDAIITNAAGCGAMLKDYGHLLPAADADAAGRFVAKVRDVHEFLAELGPVPPPHPVEGVATYHDACHLCHAQQVKDEPRGLLALIPGLRMVPLDESELCCGAAGTYNLTQPAMSRRLGRRKLDRIAATGASIVATGNVGCILQIARQVKESGRPIEVVHPIDLLDRAYRGPSG